MKKECIVSFGNSTEYRLTLTEGASQVADLKEEVKSYLAKKFPDLNSLNFYDKMTVIPVTPENEEKYRGYKEFDSNSIDEIKAVLSREVEGSQSVRELNDNAPWSSATAKM